MRRRLDDHPGVNSSSGVFSSAVSGGFPPRQQQQGPTARAKPQRQPLALLQDSIHGSGDMQGVQFTVQSPSFQPRIGSGGLSQTGHNHSLSSVHHSLGNQAHSAQVMHQSHSQAPLHGPQQQQQQHQQQFQRLKVEDALSYLDQVKFKFGSQPQVYNDFLDIMKEFKSQSIDTPGVIQRVSNLFKGHPELIVGFNTFLPPGYRIEVQANEQVNVSMPGSLVPAPLSAVGGASNAGPAPPNSSPSTATAASPGHAVPPLASAKQPNHNSAASQPAHVSPGGQQGYSSGAPPNSGSAPAAAQAGQPVEFNHAINYVNKIKNRFQGQPDIYKQFLEILHTYQKEQRNLKEGIPTGTKPLTESEVYAQVAKLFQNQEDLLQEFGQFLPDANGASAHSLLGLVDFNSDRMGNARGPSLSSASTPAVPRKVPHSVEFGAFQPSKAMNNDHTATVKKPSLGKPGLGLTGAPTKQSQPMKRPLLHIPSQGSKKQKMTSLKDVTLAEAGKHGTLNEFAFFDKVRRALRGQEVYDNFLRCLILYNQEIVSRSELVHLITPFLGKFSELFKWFKDFIGYKDLGGQVEPIPNKVSQQERISGDLSMEIDYSSCKRYGASYRALPKNYVQPKCSGRTALCREVLNDTWVSFPSWSEDSTFVSSRKTQYEEYIYRCEDERFELDVVVETNLATIRVLEAVQKKMQRMSAEERQRFRLDDTLGGSSSVIQQRAIRRIYGDKSPDIIEGLKKNPVVAVPLVLRRLKAKEEEWREAQKSFNKIWRDQNEKYYLKSLDHQGITFKPNDVKYLRSKSLLNEIEAIYEERREQIEEGVADVPSGPHMTFVYQDRSILDDAANLIIHHVKRQTGINKEDKQKIKELIRQFIPDLFCLPRGELSDDDMEKDDDIETEDGESQPLPGSLSNHQEEGPGGDVPMGEDRHPGNDNPKPPPDGGGSPESNKDTGASPMHNIYSDDSYSLFFVNDHWYLFFRLHHLLCERLTKIYRQAMNLAAEEAKERKDRKESTAVALRLKPKSEIEVEDYYLVFLDMVKSLLDGNMETSQYEDTLREMFGIHAYTMFTFDKVVQNAVRQLQHIMCDEACQRCMELFLEEQKSGASGFATATQRAAMEAAYQKKAEQVLTNDTCFKIVLYQREARLTIELMDTESDASEDPVEVKWSEYVEKYVVGDDSVSDELREQLAKKPVFLPRNVRARRQQARKQENDAKKQQPSKSPCLNDESTNDEPPPSSFGTRASSPPSQDKMEVMDDTQCKFNINSYKMVFVVNSSSYIYNRMALCRAQQTHRKVSERMRHKFRAWQQSWLERNVSSEQGASCHDWLMGTHYENSTTTRRLQEADHTRPPYATYHKYRTLLSSEHATSL
ncbi:paired amphipathic helix protein Sin3a-like [Ornithodoros turicata]|uniref:paired amphipathic helix protein Sin3a-like n=1 Tax=Ornithodoros turicata TaxID=34597 RepID=UPI003138CAAF